MHEIFMFICAYIHTLHKTYNIMYIQYNSYYNYNYDYTAQYNTIKFSMQRKVQWILFTFTNPVIQYTYIHILKQFYLSKTLIIHTKVNFYM